MAVKFCWPIGCTLKFARAVGSSASRVKYCDLTNKEKKYFEDNHIRSASAEWALSAR
jgi:hypothetical protein